MMAIQPIFEQEIRRSANTQWIAFVSSLSIMCIVFIAVSVFAGAPSGFEVIMPFLIAGTVVFALGAFWIYWQTRCKLQIFQEGSHYRIVIVDPSRSETLEAISPFNYDYCWFEAPVGKYNLVTKELYLGFRDRAGQGLFSLHFTLGSLNQDPPWPKVSIQDYLQLQFPNCYDMGKLVEFVDQIQTYEDHLPKQLFDGDIS